MATGEPDHLALHPAPGREVPRRHAVHRGRRDLHLGARLAPELAVAAVRDPGRQASQDRRLHGRVRAGQAEPGDARARDDHLRDEQGLGDEEQGRPAAGLQGQGGDVRVAQRQRHRTVDPRVARAGHTHRAEAQRRLVGHQGRARAGQRDRSDLHAGERRRDADGGAAVRAGGLRARPAAAGPPPAGGRQGDQGRPRPGEPGRLLRLRPEPRRTAVLQRQGQEPVQGRARANRRLPGDRHRGDPHADHAQRIAADGRHHAVDPRVEPGRREAPPVRPRPGEATADRSRLSERLRRDARLPQQPLHQRRGDLPRGRGDAGEDRHPDEGDDDAAGHLLPEAGEVRHEHVHAGLGRRDHRRADDAVAGAALARSRRPATARSTTAATSTRSSTR